ncbi:anti-sigma factor [Agromyces sp. Marseille-P2726]|uniref:anti-sigma factor n=1 Tax=Agromyces sp. Marseille-P2726 TaxID=2709132 RepID=UPI00156FFDD7|nr:anti-sigma factor [Agromyces sp. Marseille-P2726]
MRHIEPEDLAVLALDGNEPDAAARGHLDECAECLAEYEAFARTAALGRGGVAREHDAYPSPSVWAGIHSELGLDPALAPDPLAARDDAPAMPVPPPAPALLSTADEPASAPSRGGGTRWWVFALAAAGAGILAGVGLGLGIAQTLAPPAETVLARAALEPFPGWEASGEALVEEDDDGVRSIVVDLDSTVPSGSVREVWLIRSDASGLVSLGLLDGASGRFTLPSGIDLGEYPIVDVSAEPLDGEPAHSGDSIVRGELQEERSS